MITRPALILFLTGLYLSLALQPASAADSAKADAKAAAPNVPMSTVLQNLKMNGYEIITSVDLDNDVYDIRALTPQGKELSIKMDAHSGEITSPKQNPIPQLSLPDAVKRVEGSGYHDISSVEYSGEKYIIRTLDERDAKVKLKVDGNTGEINKAWF